MRRAGRLSSAEVRARLAALNRAAGRAPWRAASGRLRKRFVFGDFAAAFGFMSEVALAAQAMDHHPDWSNSYATVEVTLSTHSAGGLTALDFDLASRIEAIVGSRARKAPSPATAKGRPRRARRGPAPARGRPP